MSRYFELSFNDLSFETQQEWIESVAESLLDKWKEEGEDLLKRKWIVACKNWQEAYCRTYAVDFRMWNDLDENSEEFQKYDWLYAIKEEAENKAEEACHKGVKHTEIEVEI